jgi:uncharacterized protein YajQ (UPF0234 family)
MAREGLATTLAFALGAATALGTTGAVAQSVDQLQNRYELQRSQQQLDRQATERRFESDLRNQQMQDRVERQAIERRLSTPRLQPRAPAGTLRRY